jgi:predicted component of type VI protein secretion system
MAKKERKPAAKLENIRKFVYVHKDGKEEVFASSRIAAKIQIEEILAQKGMSWKRDKKDFYEVRI